MTPRKELFVTVKEALSGIAQLELIDLFRNQFTGENWTAAFIRINSIKWETMTGFKQEGDCVVDVILFTQEGWLDQHQNTTDEDGGLNEIDLIDSIIDALQFLKGDQFKPLQQSDEDDIEQQEKGVFSYSISFETKVYRTLKNPYTSKKITLNP